MDIEFWKILPNRYNYDFMTGVITHKRTNKSKNTVNYKGYVNVIIVKLNNITRTFTAHRVAWYLGTGEIPPSNMHVDHINRNRSDNRLCNLRLLTPQENSWNSNHTLNSKLTGLPRGVYLDKVVKSSRKYYIQLKIDGVLTRIERFYSPDTAKAFYDSACEYYRNGFTATGRKPRNIQRLRNLAKWLNFRIKSFS